ncbi:MULTISPECIES: hypothetical protein [unclassified Burkholderia]|uniref:hypothetical protein n=1 Tax=unclassified Burkholderia TaxID=2613784 RepID=UPI000467F6CB|nr:MULTISPECIES: hypothetical protein [unclassified Burkholderia]NIE85594.1 hypothetical protein [Burkholderia sp. Tr-860]NIF63965.1 hypothetical protein [Burkholderia sp. Cy-647]NIF72604.1 hypothetical protein [Burkholderia sp. Ap-962]NIF92447.1 hypothetical protein [Burkholderia sp. Cy-637]NIF98556.1 hypothetical protein [Burkholderia sp. Ax-1720]
MSANDASGRPASPPSRPKTMLRRLLSHHEIATLLVLLHAPIAANAKPELPALEEAGLVEMVGDGPAPLVRLTADGSAVLKGLGFR